MSSEEIKAEYTSSLADLTFNSKPLINVLTMLAEENLQNASDIVEAIETHLSKVHTDVKLPILYLMDCIVKNVGGIYKELFSQNVVSTFCNVFKVVDEKTRAEMYKLRQTWNDQFPQKKLYAIDVQINLLDPAWPVTAQPPSNVHIHFNPKFLKNEKPTKILKNDGASVDHNKLLEMQKDLLEKKKGLLEMQKKKIELELAQVNLRVTGANIVTKDPRKAYGNQINKLNSLHQKIPSNPNAPKISPVSSALISAANKRPVTRDPRLQKMQSQANKEENVQIKVTRTDPRLNNVSSNKKSPPKIKQDKINKSPSKSSSDSLKSSSNSSLEAEDKKKSPSKNKKKDKYEEKRKDSDKRSKKVDVAAFKDAKSSKSRNYVRRNRSPSPPSPEDVPQHQDVDLRASLGPPEKQLRLQSDDKSVSKDVDLRQLPAMIGKKRPSTEALDGSNPKKSKTEVFDILFGNEDTDLRKLPSVVNDRPPTPPPPIISNKINDVVEINSPPKKNDKLDAIRAKLANATNRDKIFAKSFHKKKLAASSEENKPQIIISQDDEQDIKDGKITKEQESRILNQIIMQMEKSKLIEAKKKDLDESVINISTQSISDDDLDESYNSEDERERERFKKEVYGVGGKDNGDKEDRGHEKGQQFPKFREQRWQQGGHWRGSGRRGRHWENPVMHPGPQALAPRPGARPWLNPPNSAWRPLGAPRFDFHPPSVDNDDSRQSPEISAADLVVGPVNQEDIKNINIDGTPRDIRYYDEVAVVFMNWDDPREIGFQDGMRGLSFNDAESYMLSFNEPYKEVNVNGGVCQVRLGVPCREIFINHKPYECYFGGPGITIDLEGVKTLVKLEGPPPQVKIGPSKRTDLVAGRISLIIDAKIIVPVFLDAKPQHFTLDGETHTLKFVDSLQTVLINDCPFNVEFGGLPKPVQIHGKKHFIRFSVLPRGVRPGRVRLQGMAGARGLSPPPVSIHDDMQQNSSRDGFDMQPNFSNNANQRMDSPDRNSNSPNIFQNILQQSNHLDLLSSVISSASNEKGTSGGYQVENFNQTNSDNQQKTSAEAAPANSINPLNINDLFQKLVQSGIVATSPFKENAKPKVRLDQQILDNKPRRSPMENLKMVSFSKPETLKSRQGSLYGVLYSGMQCSSCGMRFPPEQTTHYSQHLDWHFRQNRKGKKNIRVASSRRWYYSLSDWKNYEEIEDLEEREKNFFDQQATQAEGAENDAEEEVEIPTIPADPDVTKDYCEVCKDKFDQFFNEEKEEWHFRNAMKIEENYYHPLCYEDHLRSLQEVTLDESQIDVSATKEEENKELIPGLQIILDDDDVESVHNSNSEVIIDESDDEKDKNEPDVDGEESKDMFEDPPQEDDDDDVILNEEAPVKIVIDDDDDDDELHREQENNVGNKKVTVKKEKIEIDDGFEDVGGVVSLPNGGHIKIKAEPVDLDENPLDITDPELGGSLTENNGELESPQKESTVSAHPTFLTSIDGNVELNSNVAATASKGIKINISKPLSVIAPKETSRDAGEGLVDPTEGLIDPSQPLPPGEEPVQLNLKPALQGVALRKMPPVAKGAELSGLCSIM
ncbi:unnamed protein product [Brassicogethes aeneus]|uniref:Pre-mRNA cleavage complex 2 protein Pcf11 n=1 Tax=Brassicogethes aeneus TaxID=1431903 RepID=A0A9P0BDI4_BRAAE|nr:unnamed protein product [Brassicogethes aeneus]